MNRTDRILASAEQHCREQGVRMTPQRRQVMTLLLAQSGPQSAYQLLDQFKAQYQENAQPPTIYRALEFLVQQGLAHRLSSTNQYLACDHITCHHGHQGTVFLLCDDCGAVQHQRVAAEYQEPGIRDPAEPLAGSAWPLCELQRGLNTGNTRL